MSTSARFVITSYSIHYTKLYDANGENPTRAYQQLHPKLKSDSARRGAYRWLRQPDVRSFLRKLRAISLEDDLLERMEVRGLLARIARDESNSVHQRLRAMHLGEERFNEIGVNDRDGHLITILEARTFRNNFV